MARRPKRGERASETTIPHLHEGPEVLSVLLARAGSRYGAEDVIQLFRKARAAGQEASDVIPTLFEREPRVGSPDEAKRLYGNLFGCWDEAQADEDPAERSSDPPEPEQAAVERALPPRGEARGSSLTLWIVESVWKHLDSISDGDRKRLRHRFENAQPDLVAWLDSITLTETGALAVHDLAFEIWAMFDVAFGDRLGTASFRDLQSLEAEPPPIEAVQPALLDYVEEVLDLAVEDAPGFDIAQRAQTERAVSTLAAVLTAAVEPEEPEE